MQLATATPLAPLPALAAAAALIPTLHAQFP